MGVLGGGSLRQSVDEIIDQDVLGVRNDERRSSGGTDGFFK
jgi:hypothetical protein